MLVSYKSFQQNVFQLFSFREVKRNAWLRFHSLCAQPETPPSRAGDLCAPYCFFSPRQGSRSTLRSRCTLALAEPDLRSDSGLTKLFTFR
jgi:hypothetical protein